MQSFYGNTDLGPEWETVGETGKICGGKWRVFIRGPHNDSEWRQVKIACDGYAKAKANYWLQFNGTRFAGGAEYWKLVEHRFELAEAAMVLLGGDPKKLVPFDPEMAPKRKEGPAGQRTAERPARGGTDAGKLGKRGGGAMPRQYTQAEKDAFMKLLQGFKQAAK